MNRAERRRYAKEVAKGNIKINEAPKSRLVPKALVDGHGKKYTTLEEYITAMEKEICDQCSEISSKMLYESEEHMGTANIVIMLYAVLFAFENLKTVQKNLGRVISKYNDAVEFVDAIGIKEAYDRLHERHGINLDVEDYDLGAIFDSEEIYRRYKMRLVDKAEGGDANGK